MNDDKIYITLSGSPAPAENIARQLEGYGMNHSDNKSVNRPDPDKIEFIRSSSGAIPVAPLKKDRRELTFRAGMLIIILLVAVLLAGGLILYPIANQKSTENLYGDGTPYTGVLVVNGEIAGSSDTASTYQHSWTLARIREMKNDQLNEGILLYVNSPGGSVFETDELYTELKKYKKQTKRPVYAYFDEMAASGGYYIAAGSDKIIANRLCTTGSIGVYMGPVIDSSKLLTKLGVGVKYIKSGRNKAMGNPFTPLTKEQEEIYQSQIDEYYERFAKIVSRGRHLPMETVYTVADGRSYTAKQALANHLIDEIGNYNQAKKIMKKNCQVNQFVVVQYQPEVSIWNYFTKLCDTFAEYVNEQGKSETQKTLEYLSENGGHTFYYKIID